MDWLTGLWLTIIVASVIFMLAIDRYFRKRRNNRRLGLRSDVQFWNFNGNLSSENSLKPKLGGDSGGGAGTTRNFAALTTESAGVADVRVITVNSIMNGELRGDMVLDEVGEHLLPFANTNSNIIDDSRGRFV